MHNHSKTTIASPTPNKDKNPATSFSSKKTKNKRWADQVSNEDEDEEGDRLMKIYDKDSEFAKVYLQFLREKH